MLNKKRYKRGWNKNEDYFSYVVFIRYPANSCEKKTLTGKGQLQGHTK